MSQCDARRPVHSSATASRVFSGEAVVITPAENIVRMFNTVGSRIWELLDGRRTVDEIIGLLIDEYTVGPDEARSGVEHFLEELADKGLIRFVSAGAEATS